MHNGRGHARPGGEVVVYQAGVLGTARQGAKLNSMSPTVLRVKGFRFYFFSREERRAHVHVQHADGEAKFWIEPTVEMATNFGLKPKQVAEVEQLIEEHLDEIRSAWAKHFPGRTE